MNTRDAAELLSDILGVVVTPKALRRHLRKHSDRWTAAGMGNLYTLSKNDVRAIAKEMRDDVTKAVKESPTKVDPFPELNGKPLTTPTGLRQAQRDRALMAALEAGRRARYERLHTRMREVGVGVR